MASVTFSKMARFSMAQKTFLPVLYFPVIDHGPKRVVLLANVNKLRKANSKTQEF